MPDSARSRFTKRLRLRKKREFEEFFPDGQVPGLHPFHQNAQAYLSNVTKQSSAASAVRWLPNDLNFQVIIALCFVSLVLHLAYRLWQEELPYLPVVNSLPCAWYTGKNNSDSVSYFGLPYALPPLPQHYENEVINSKATELLQRWRPSQEAMSSPIRCLLAHRSSSCQFSRGVHSCSVISQPKFCSHFRMQRLRRRQSLFNISKDNDTMASPSDDGSVSEDCLFLSISRPKDYRNGHYPIIVFVTGSGFVSETTWNVGQESLLHPAESLAAKLEAVVVRINYRLAYYATFDENARGPIRNFGFLDLIEGLRYLRKVASEFGGDAQRVTIFGHGSAAALVMALLTYQKSHNERLVQAAWISSGPSQIPINFGSSSVAEQVKNQQSQQNDQLSQNNTQNFTQSLLKLDQAELIEVLTADQRAYRDWINTGYFTDLGHDLALFVGAKESNQITNMVWLAPDGRSLLKSPTEGDGPQQWDDVPIIFANVDSHYEGFPGFGINDKWIRNTLEILKKMQSNGYISKDPVEFLEYLAAIPSRRDQHDILYGVRAASWLRFICAYRFLAKKVAATPKRLSKVYHFIMEYALSFEARFLPINSDKKLIGAFYGLDLLLLLGTAPQVAEDWNRRDEAFMNDMQQSMKQFIHNRNLPKQWQPTDSYGSHTVVANIDGTINSYGKEAQRFKFCDSINFEKVVNLRTKV